MTMARFLVQLAAVASLSAPALAATPNPVLIFTGTEYYTTGGKHWVRHRYEVANKEAFSAAMFAPAPSLPPCGTNTNSARSWVDFFDGAGRRIYGFCALGSPANLANIWFASEVGKAPPMSVYIEIHDRQVGIKYKSNLAATME